MAQQANVEEVIRNAAETFCRYYESEYPNCQLVKEGLKCLLSDRYGNDAKSFADNFVHPTLSLLSDLQEKQFPLCSNDDEVILHLVPPVLKLQLGEFFYQVGHTYPGTLVVKFAKYEKRGTSSIVNPLQRSEVNRADYDIAFTKEYFDDIRSGAPQGLGDVLMRTLIVLSKPKWAVQREGAVEYYLRACPRGRHGRLQSDSHLSTQESCDESSASEPVQESCDESSTSEPNSPTEHDDFSSQRDDPFRRLYSSEPKK